jgi:hypothetical protein
MIAQALGWDNHRKFSNVSLMEPSPDGQICGDRAGETRA